MTRTRKTTAIFGSKVDMGSIKDCKTDQDKLVWLDLYDKHEKTYYMRGFWKRESVEKFLSLRGLHYRCGYMHIESPRDEYHNCTPRVILDEKI